MSESPPVLAFTCDAEGNVDNVVTSELGVEGLEAGRSMLDMVDAGSREKAREFITTLRQKKAVSGWELTVACDKRLCPLVFSGAMRDGTMLVVAGRSASDIRKKMDEMAQLNNEQINQFRQMFAGQRDEFDVRARRGQDAYDDLSRLNNELANAQRELFQTTVELRRLSEERVRFLGMAAHDLRNPLSVIMAYAELLGQDLKSASPAVTTMIEEIRNSSRFMISIINELLDVSKIDSGADVVERTVFDPVAAVDRRLTAYRVDAAKKDIRIDLQRPSAPVRLNSDPNKLARIVDNLVSNAIKYSSGGTSVVVKLSVEEKTFRLAVSDQGKGITAEDLNRLFQPFVRLNASGTAGERSTGLGLLIVSRLAELLGGSIRAASEIGRGSTFTLILPLE